MPTRGERGISLVEFESQRRAIAIDILEECRVFMETDMKIVQSFAQISQTIADYISKNPELLVTGGDSRALAAALEQGRGDLTAAGDVTGGDALDTIQKIIDLIKSALGDEKGFIQKIIEHILGI